MKAAAEKVTTAAGFLDKQSAARFCDLGERTLNTAMATGALPYIRFSSRKVLFRVNDLVRWLESRRVDVTTAHEVPA